MASETNRYLVTWSDDQMDHTELLELTDEEKDRIETWLEADPVSRWEGQVVDLNERSWWADFSDFRIAHWDDEEEPDYSAYCDAEITPSKFCGLAPGHSGDHDTAVEE